MVPIYIAIIILSTLMYNSVQLLEGPNLIIYTGTDIVLLGQLSWPDGCNRLSVINY